MKKEFFSIEATNLVLDKNPGMDYSDATQIAYLLECKYPDLKYNLENYWKHLSFDKIPENLYLDRCKRIERFLDKAQKFRNDWTGNLEILGGINQEKFDFFRQNYVNYSLYGRRLATGHHLSSFDVFENFHKLLSVMDIPDYEFQAHLKWNPRKKPKFLDQRVEFFKYFVEYFWDKHVQYLEYRRMLIEKREFKSAKKRLFAFKINVSGFRYSLDWFDDIKDEFYLLISHIDEGSARSTIAYNRGTEREVNYDGVFKKLCKGDPHNVGMVSLETMLATKAIVQQANTRKKERYNPRYDSYGSFYTRRSVT